MGCCGGERQRPVVKEVHKWHYINLADFRTSNCLTVFSYIWVWILAATAVAVYVLDTFTAVKLLGFNQWASTVQPAVPFGITKWIFAGCILFSWVLCFYEWIRAIRVMKQESVTEDYLDPLAVVLQSIRIPGGWRRFLVFAELTKSKKKAAWIAIFVYFQRKGAIRILAAEGPRMVLNGITLYSVARTKFVDGPQVKGKPLIISFLNNIKNLYIQDRTSAMVLCSMAFTLIIWVISMIFLITALLFWVFFIAHYVDRETLTGYCRRKVETRLAKIVKAKTDKVWEKEQKKRMKEEGKSDTKDQDDSFDAIKRQPTLPVFENLSPPKSGGFLSRTESVSTLPRYTSQPQTPADDYPSLPSLPTLSRTNTGAYSANASLLGNAGAMGQSGPISRPSTGASSHTYNSSYSRDPSMPSLPPLSIPANDPRFPPSSRGTLMLSAERRYSPQGSTPWRTPVSAVDEDAHGYEMQEPTLPSALRPAMGQRRDVSSPGPNRTLMPSPPQRSFTEPNAPGSISRSMTPGAGSGMPRSMAPGNGAGIPRSMTPTSPPRSMTPTGQPRSPPRGPTSGLPRAMTPGDPMRSQTPGMQQSMRPTGGSKPRGWGHGPPGMAI